MLVERRRNVRAEEMQVSVLGQNCGGGGHVTGG